MRVLLAFCLPIYESQSGETPPRRRKSWRLPAPIEDQGEGLGVGSPVQTLSQSRKTESAAIRTLYTRR